MSENTSTASEWAADHMPDSPHITIEPRILYFGTPVALLSTENEDGSFNLAPMSSAWALGQVVVLGLGASSQTGHNLSSRPDLVINLPAPHQWQAVERLAPLTGRYPLPEHKKASFRFERDKFDAAGLCPEPSQLVRPPRVAECPLQLEARAMRVAPAASDDFLVIEAEVLKVHADPSIVVPGTQHIDPSAWSPLVYNFRHYFGLGSELGHSFRSDTPRTTPATAPVPGAGTAARGGGEESGPHRESGQDRRDVPNPVHGWPGTRPQVVAPHDDTSRPREQHPTVTS